VPAIEGRPRRTLVVAGLLVVAALVIAVEYSRIGGTEPALPPDAAPQGVDLFWARAASNPHGLVAYDWAGARRGSATLPTWVQISRLRPAPDGSGFMLDPATPGDYAAYFDRVGRTRFETDDPGFISQSWADDSTHVCVLSDTGLIARIPGEPDRVLRPGFGTQMTVAGCSVRTDVVILASADQIQVAKFSTGKVIRSADLPTGGTVVASTDASYLAVSTVGTQPVEVYRTTDLSRPLAELDATLTPIAFSGDDSLLLTRSDDGTLHTLTWRTGKEAWMYGPAGAQFWAAVARPSGADFVVYLSSGPVLIRRNGKSASF
jgi:hypothetical protein